MSRCAPRALSEQKKGGPGWGPPFPCDPELQPGRPAFLAFLCAAISVEVASRSPLYHLPLRWVSAALSEPVLELMLPVVPMLLDPVPVESVPVLPGVDMLPMSPPAPDDDWPVEVEGEVDEVEGEVDEVEGDVVDWLV